MLLRAGGPGAQGTGRRCCHARCRGFSVAQLGDRAAEDALCLLSSLSSSCCRHWLLTATVQLPPEPPEPAGTLSLSGPALSPALIPPKTNYYQARQKVNTSNISPSLWTMEIPSTYRFPLIHLSREQREIPNTGVYRCGVSWWGSQCCSQSRSPRTRHQQPRGFCGFCAGEQREPQGREQLW